MLVSVHSFCWYAADYPEAGESNKKITTQLFHCNSTSILCYCGRLKETTPALDVALPQLPRKSAVRNSNFLSRWKPQRRWTQPYSCWAETEKIFAEAGRFQFQAVDSGLFGDSRFVSVSVHSYSFSRFFHQLTNLKYSYIMFKIPYYYLV